jgi:hypothetical protein
MDLSQGLMETKAETEAAESGIRRVQMPNGGARDGRRV